MCTRTKGIRSEWAETSFVSAAFDRIAAAIKGNYSAAAIIRSFTINLALVAKQWEVAVADAAKILSCHS